MPEMIEDYRDTYPEVTGELPADDTFVGFHGGILSRFGKAVMRLFLLPANALGFLKNDGNGNLTWASGTIGNGAFNPEDYGDIGSYPDIDSGIAIQAAIDAACAAYAIDNVRHKVTLTCVPQKLRIDKPLRAIAPIDIDFNGCHLYGYYGSGHILQFRSDTHATPTFAASLVSGSGQSLVLGTDSHYRPMFCTEPELRLDALTEVQISFFAKRTAANSQGPYYHTGLFAGTDYQGPSIWRLSDGRIRVYWGNGIAPGPTVGGTTYGKEIDTATSVWPDDDNVYYVSLNFKNSVVKVYLGVAGGTATEVLSFDSLTSTVPMLPSGIQCITVGNDDMDPYGGPQTGFKPTAKIDSLRVSKTARTGSFTAPSSKHTLTGSDVLFLCNFEYDTDLDLMVGYVGNALRGTANKAYICCNSDEYQISGSRVRNATVACSYGGSGIWFHDTIFNVIEDVNISNGPHGLVYSGTTYGSNLSRVSVSATSYGLIQTSQSMVTSCTGCTFASNGICVYWNGAVGGAYTDLYLTPYSGAWAVGIIRSTQDVSIYYTEIDNEGQAEGLNHNFILSEGASFKSHDGIYIALGAFPLFDCYDTSNVHLTNIGLSLGASVTEVIKHHSTPEINSSISVGSWYGNTNPPPISLTPQYVDYTPAHQATLSMSGNHTGQSVADCEYLLVSTSSDGQILRGLTPGKHKGIINAGSNTLVLSNQDASAYAANYRFVTSDGTDLTLEPGNMALVVRDNSSSRNRIFLLNGTSSTPTVDGAFVTSGGDYFVTSGGDYLVFAP